MTSTIGLSDSGSAHRSRRFRLLSRRRTPRMHFSSVARLEPGSWCIRCSDDLFALMAPSCYWRQCSATEVQGTPGSWLRGRALSGVVSKPDGRCRHRAWSLWQDPPIHSARLNSRVGPVLAYRTSRMARWARSRCVDFDRPGSKGRGSASRRPPDTGGRRFLQIVDGEQGYRVLSWRPRSFTTRTPGNSRPPTAI